MQSMTKAGEKCLADGNLLGAVAIAVTLPDICGRTLPGLGSGERYRKWFNEWVAGKFLGADGEPVLSAADCWQLRCRLLHEGRGWLGEDGYNSVHEVQFFDDTLEEPFLEVEVGTYPATRLLLMRARFFSERIFASVDEFEAQLRPLARLKRGQSHLCVLTQYDFEQEYPRYEG